MSWLLPTVYQNVTLRFRTLYRFLVDLTSNNVSEKTWITVLMIMLF